MRNRLNTVDMAPTAFSANAGPNTTKVKMSNEGNQTPGGSPSELLEKAMRYNLDPVVRRFSADHDVPMEIAKEHEIELKKFMVLSALHPKKAYGLPQSLDDLWHTFIIHTKTYFDFCKNICGFYVHHIPLEEKTNESVDAYQSYLDDYDAAFNVTPPTQIFPEATRENLEDIASCGRSIAGCRGGL